MRYSIDIDGVITNKISWSFEDSFHRYREMLLKLEPCEEGIKAVNKLFDAGHIIILNTSRLWRDFDATVQWLKEHGVKYHTLIMAKPLADFYVDDKNITMEEFLK